MVYLKIAKQLEKLPEKHEKKKKERKKEINNKTKLKQI